MSANNKPQLNTIGFELDRIASRIEEAGEIFSYLAENCVSAAELKRYSERGKRWLAPAKAEIEQIICELQTQNYL